MRRDAPWGSPLLLATLIAGCESGTRRPCMEAGALRPIVARAVRFRLDAYDPVVRCDGPRAAGDSAAAVSGSFRAGDPLHLDLPPGPRTVVLTAYADEAATVVLGAACGGVDLPAGGELCLDLELVASADGPSACFPDASADVCPTGLYCGGDGLCVAGCKLDVECAGGAAPRCCAHRCVDVRSDVESCGGCGLSCGGGAALCCDARCVDPQIDAANCGGCGHACDATHADATSCLQGGCRYTCQPGFGDCRSDPPDLDGCESSLASVEHCGACGHACDTLHSLGASCAGGGCAYAGCQPGFADCAMAGPDLDGCESSLTSIEHCGACGRACDLTDASSAICDGAACTYSCFPGFADCLNAPPDLDGCETATATTTDCGGCGNRCDTLSTVGAGCDGTRCTYAACAAGLVDCNTGPPNTDGCECATPGCCGQACQFAHTNGLGGTFFDCAPVGTHNAAQALSACAAFTGDPARCTSFNCGTGNKAVCSIGAPTCVCWTYQGQGAGLVVDTGSTICQCATPPAPTWN